MLLALGDGRALPASRLAAEAGVTPATVSSHLAKLVAAGLLVVENHGRHRFFRLSGPDVGQLIEALAQLAPAQLVRSLRQGTRAQALRNARTCYDHLAGRLGVGIMTAMLARGYLSGGDGQFDVARRCQDRLNAYGTDVSYGLTAAGYDAVTVLGVRLTSARPVIRYCVDWSEQRHHLSGSLGRELLNRLIEIDWVRRSKASRAVEVTSTGCDGLATYFDFTWPVPPVV